MLYDNPSRSQRIQELRSTVPERRNRIHFLRNKINMKRNILNGNIKSITITPIGSGKSKQTQRAREDFEEQVYKNNIENMGVSTWCWDDSKHNNSEVGQLFGFRNNNTHQFIIHVIISVKDPSHRLPLWSQNVGHSNRNVLELSHPIHEMTIQQWVQMGGSNAHMGTHKSTKGLDTPAFQNLIQYL
jgi:hypothetical protein